MDADLVIIGLGYVGLPVALEATRAGLRVTGLDVSEEIVAGLGSGRSHVDDVTDPDIAEMLHNGFEATTDPACLAQTDAVVVCVPTPLNDDGIPDLGAVRSAASRIGEHLQPGTLVVLESTTYPGTTDEIVRPIIEKTSGLVAGSDFHLAYSPERIDPGNPQWGLRNTPKIVGGHTPACTQVATALYGKLVNQVVVAKGTREAELAKLLENTYRHVNIALMNEMSAFCHELGVDLWDAIDMAATKPFGYQAFYPGPGVGGHCIPIDPNYLSYRVRRSGFPFRFVELAQEINSRMPSYVAARAQRLLNADGKPVRRAKILLLGVTYKPDIADQRESPVNVVGKELLDLGADLAYHDPYVAEWTVDGSWLLKSVEDLDAALVAADLTIVLQPHSSYNLSAIAELSRRVLDTRGCMDGPHVQRL